MVPRRVLSTLQLLVCVTVVLQSPQNINADVVTLTDTNYRDTVNEPIATLWFVKFYEPWCRWSQQLAPAWQQLGHSVKSKPGLEVGAVDCTANMATCLKENIMGYPTMKLFYNGREVDVYHGQRDFQSLRKYLLEQYARVAVKGSDSVETMLGEEDFRVLDSFYDNILSNY